MELVDVTDLTVHQDERGYLFEIIHNYDMENGFGQAYIVHNPVKGTIRAFHKHQELIDYFTIVKGSAKFVFANNEVPDIVESITLTDRNPQMITVPTEIFHGWKSLEDDTILLSVGSEVYDEEDPDEERIAWNFCGGDVWEKLKK